MKSPSPKVDNTPMTVQVTVKAQRVHDNRNGTFTLEVQGRTLTSEEHKMLQSLFPNLFEAAYGLLNKETLLAALATDAEANFRPEESETPKY